MDDEKAWKAGTGQKIDKLYAWVATEADGGEGIVGVMTPIGMVPAIGADRARIESYRAQVKIVAAQMGTPVSLKLFGTGIVLDTI